MTEQLAPDARLVEQVVLESAKPVPVTLAADGTVMLRGPAPVLVRVLVCSTATPAARAPKSMSVNVADWAWPEPETDTDGLPPLVLATVTLPE